MLAARDIRIRSSPTRVGHAARGRSGRWCRRRIGVIGRCASAREARNCWTSSADPPGWPLPGTDRDRPDFVGHASGDR